MVFVIKFNKSQLRIIILTRIPANFRRSSGELPANSGELPANSGELRRTSGELRRTSGGVPADFRRSSGGVPASGVVPAWFRHLCFSGENYTVIYDFVFFCDISPRTARFNRSAWQGVETGSCCSHCPSLPRCCPAAACSSDLDISPTRVFDMLRGRRFTHCVLEKIEIPFIRTIAVFTILDGTPVICNSGYKHLAI